MTPVSTPEVGADRNDSSQRRPTAKKLDLWGVVFRPSTFDPQKRYPVVERVETDPKGFFTPKTFDAAHPHQALADRGFIVVQVDARGTSGRTKAFQDASWRNISDAGLADRVDWIRALAAHDASLDLTRVGIFGSNTGARTALRALLLHGDVYRAAVADGGPHEPRWSRMEDVEPWMGYPIGPHYAEQSNLNHLSRLQGDLLLMVGGRDRQSTPKTLCGSPPS